MAENIQISPENLPEDVRTYLDNILETTVQRVAEDCRSIQKVYSRVEIEEGEIFSLHAMYIGNIAEEEYKFYTEINLMFDDANQKAKSDSKTIVNKLV